MALDPGTRLGPYEIGAPIGAGCCAGADCRWRPCGVDRHASGARPGTRTSIVLPQTQQRTNVGRRGVAISPSGTHIAFVANNRLYLRALDQLEAQPLTGTDSDASSPFFSPDGGGSASFQVAIGS